MVEDAENLAFLIGDEVEVQSQDLSWSPGKIEAVLGANHFMVAWDDGDCEGRVQHRRHLRRAKVPTRASVLLGRGGDHAGTRSSYSEHSAEASRGQVCVAGSTEEHYVKKQSSQIETASSKLSYESWDPNASSAGSGYYGESIIGDLWSRSSSVSSMPSDFLPVQHMRSDRTNHTMEEKCSAWKAVKTPAFNSYARSLLLKGPGQVTLPVPEEVYDKSATRLLEHPKKLSRSYTHDTFPTMARLAQGSVRLSFTMRDEEGVLVSFLKWQDALGQSGRGSGKAESLKTFEAPIKDAVKKRANMQIQALQLSLVAKKFEIKNRSSAVFDHGAARIEQRAAANNFDTKYAAAQDVINSWISFRRPPRAHSIGGGELPSDREVASRSSLLP